MNFQAHEQLKAVLLSLLDELPSNFPIFLLGTSSVAFADFEGDMFSVFSFHNVYVLRFLTLNFAFLTVLTSFSMVLI